MFYHLDLLKPYVSSNLFKLLKFTRNGKGRIVSITLFRMKCFSVIELLALPYSNFPLKNIQNWVFSLSYNCLSIKTLVMQMIIVNK